MSLVERVRDAFAPGGALSRAADDFRPRDGQTEMAAAVANVVEQGGALVAEAGTGVGKTFSYLVPALLSGERVLLSTATKTLQDQLFGRDLPRLLEALALPVRTALLKGRASYLCVHRMAQARQDPTVADRTLLHTLAKIEAWAQATATGDLAELSGLDERSPVITLVTSTRENCLGNRCPRLSDCHVNLARRQALAADVVVINHHLFFADLAVRESGMAELLPSVRVAIFDEAHQLNETGVQFLGEQLSTGQLLDFGRDLLATGLQAARGMGDWLQLAGGIERAARDLRLLAGRHPTGTRLRWGDAAPQSLDPLAWGAAIGAIAQACGEAMLALDVVSELSPDLVRLRERAQALVSRCGRFGGAAAPGSVRWVEVGLQLRLVESPLDIAHAVRTRLLGIPEADEGDEPAPWEDDDAPDAAAGAAASGGVAAGRPRTWVFTSATLGDDARLSWFTEPCGLQDAQVLRVGSPFDYGEQAAVYVPAGLPRPADPAHPAQVAQLVAAAAGRLGGRTLVLTTTLRALRSIGDALQARFEGGELQVLVQGQGPKRDLIERFEQAASAGGPGCILVASASFWEGVDIPGDALELVVIDKLPFPPPGDPLVEARSQRLAAQGRNAFTHFHLPEAAVALKQGAGRLIRRETDRGVLVICDSRLATMGYGRRLLAALPPMRRLTSPQAFDDALEALAATRTSTTHPPPGPAAQGG